MVPQELRNKGLITPKTLIQHAFAEFSRNRAETSAGRLRTTRDRSEGLKILGVPQGTRVRGHTYDISKFLKARAMPGNPASY